MKGYELIKAIAERKIKDNTIIKVKMGKEYKATLKYKHFMLNWVSGEFDTSILCSNEAEFEVIEEKEQDFTGIEEFIEYLETKIDMLDKKTSMLNQKHIEIEADLFVTRLARGAFNRILNISKEAKEEE